MEVYQSILARRSIRRFRQAPVPSEVLIKCVNAARLAPCANNRQRLQYIIVDESPGLDRLFGAVSWAGYLKPSWSPPPGERPSAYVVIIADAPVKGWLAVDVGLAAENIILTAWEEGLGSCCLGSAKKSQVAADLSLPSGHEVALVVALGYPAEKPIVVDSEGSVEYWRDDRGVLRVPKKPLDSLVHHGLFGRPMERP